MALCEIYIKTSLTARGDVGIKTFYVFCASALGDKNVFFLYIYVFMQSFLFQGKYNDVNTFLLATHLTVYFEQL